MPDRLTAEIHLGFSHGTEPELLICREVPGEITEIISSRILVEDEGDELAAGLPPEDGLPGLRHDPTEPANVVSFIACEGGEPGDEDLILELSEKVLNARGYRLVGDWHEDGERFTARIAETGQAVDDTLRAVTILGDADGVSCWPRTVLYRDWESEIVEVVAASDIPGSPYDGPPVVPPHHAGDQDTSPAWSKAEEESDRFLSGLGYRRISTWEPVDLGHSTALIVETGQVVETQC